MGPMYNTKELARIWSEFLEACTGSILEQKMSKEFVKATRDAITDKVGGVFVSEKEQKRVTHLISKLQHDANKWKSEFKCLQERFQTMKLHDEKLNPKKPIWWHWVMEQCRNEECSWFGHNRSQGPIHDDIGEDINLFEKIRVYEDEQKDGTTDYKCDECGRKLHMVHRHGIVDCNVIVDENDDAIRKEPLIEGVQREGDGKYITEAEYEELKKQVQKV